MTDSSFWGTGWSFPPTFEAGNQQLNMTSGEANINQSIDCVLQTNRGERSMQPNFGSNLQSFLFRPMDSSLKSDLVDSVKQILLDYEPRIAVESVGVNLVNDDNSRAEVNIVYRIKTTNSRHNYVYPFSLTEGTNLQTKDHGL